MRSPSSPSSPPLRTFLTFVVIGILLTRLPSTPVAETMPAFAADASTTSSSSSETDIVPCVDSISETVDAETTAFTDFVKEHFQNEQQNSELIDTAVDKYRAYRDVLNTLLETYASQFSENETIAQANQIFSCQNLISDKLSAARKILVAHTRNVAAAKKTIALVDAYKKLNQQLRDLNITVATLSSAFDKLNNNLNCYPKECVK